jgi:hypothetical protein
MFECKGESSNHADEGPGSPCVRMLETDTENNLK